MFNTELINKEFLEKELLSLESGYVETVVNIIKGPIFISNCEEDLEKSSDDRKNEMQKLIEKHKENHKTNLEAEKTLAKIIPEVKKLLNN